MTQKYRIQISDGKVLGPFSFEDILRLIENGKLDPEKDKVASFPIGTWEHPLDIDHFNTALNKAEDTQVVELIDDELIEDTSQEQTVIEPVDLPEFNYEKPQMESPTKEAQDEDEEEKEDDVDLDSTLILDRDKIKSVFDEDTIKLDKDTLEEPEQIIEQEVEEAQEEVEEEEIIDQKSETVVADLSSLLEEVESDTEVKEVESSIEENLKAEALENKEREDQLLRDIVSEEEIDEDLEEEGEEIWEEIEDLEYREGKKFSVMDKLNTFKEKIEHLREEKEEVEQEEKSDLKKRRVKSLIIGLLLIFVIWEFLFPKTKEVKEIIPVYAQIRFPILEEYSDHQKSAELMNKALQELPKRNYISKVNAANNLRKSLSFKFKDNKAISYLINIYSKLLKDAKDHKKAGDIILTLMAITKNRSLTDDQIVEGSARFYHYNNKSLTALNIIENFLRIEKPKLDLMVLYLDILLEVGQLEKAKNLFSKLNKIPKKPLNVHLILSKFYEVDQQFENAKKQVLAGIKEYPRSIPLYIQYGVLSSREGKFKELEKALKKIEQFEAGKSPYYLSRLYEFKGILFAIKKDLKTSGMYFKKALSIKESDILRSRLASFDYKGANAVETLITESKIIEKMRVIHKKVVEKEWEQAFQLAIEATDLNPKYIPARSLLAKIQIKRGFFEDGLKTLEELKNDYPFNERIAVQYILALIEAFRLDIAEKELSVLGMKKDKSVVSYNKILSRYYLKKGKDILALRYLNEITKQDPLDDESLFLMAQTFLKYRKYSQAQRYLAKAIELHPDNLTYKSLWANILYELEGADTAIGYIRDLMETKKDHPKLLGDIAIYYYKSGQLKEFEEHHEKIKNLPEKEESFYEFLVESSKLNEKLEDVIQYTKELIKVDQGNIESRMALGEMLYNMKKFKEAEKVFLDVKKRLSTYPKLNYYLGKIYLNTKKIDKAEKLAKDEIKANPESSTGYFVLGLVYQTKKEYTNAARNYEVAISKDGKDVEALEALAKMKRGQNFLAESRELFLRAIKQEPSRASLHREIGYVYKGIGQSELAIESFETYLKLSPLAQDQSTIKSYIKQLKL
ncbi:MAG: tetratricopeptide repeat protein [Bacteriovoracaceae bacterium]